MRVLPRSGHIQNYERLKDPFWDATTSYIEASMGDPVAEVGLGAEAPEEDPDRSPAQ